LIQTGEDIPFEDNLRKLRAAVLAQELVSRRHEIVQWAAEGFFGMAQARAAHRRRYRTSAEDRADIFDYIERFQDPRKRHSDGSAETTEIWLSSTVDGNGVESHYTSTG